MRKTAAKKCSKFWINRRRMCGWSETRNSEEISFLFFFSTRLRQRRGEINVLNNKILRTFLWNKGWFLFFLRSLSTFPFSGFLLPHFCASWSLHVIFPSSSDCKGKKFFLLFRENAKPVKEKFLESSSITFYCFQTFIRRNYIAKKTIFAISKVVKFYWANFEAAEKV